jgi:hypothetical protein
VRNTINEILVMQKYISAISASSLYFLYFRKYEMEKKSRPNCTGRENTSEDCSPAQHGNESFFVTAGYFASLNLLMMLFNMHAMAIRNK